jgi:hypothetical protein
MRQGKRFAYVVLLLELEYLTRACQPLQVQLEQYMSVVAADASMVVVLRKVRTLALHMLALPPKVPV